MGFRPPQSSKTSWPAASPCRDGERTDHFGARVAEDGRRGYRRISENAKIRYVLYPASASGHGYGHPAEVDAYYKPSDQVRHGEQRDVNTCSPTSTPCACASSPPKRSSSSAMKPPARLSKVARACMSLYLIKVDPPPRPKSTLRGKRRPIDRKQIRAGADFELCQRQLGRPSSAGKAATCFIERGQMIPVFDSAISASRSIRSPTHPLAEYGYHIVKVLERRPTTYRRSRGQTSAGRFHR